MTKSKHTKRALFMSALSMLMCMAMLVGSTFAWFTDSVTSGKNKIVAGNLAVELEYSLDGENWATVDENTNMFKEGALWEPGYTEVVYLKVVNAGSLALKYRFGINVADKVIGETAGGEAIDLADFIKFGVVEAESVFTDRADARDAVEATASLISAGYASSEGHLTKGSSSAMLALVVYMPEEVGNAANYGAGKTQPEIYMGINVHATQDTVERDSFDEKYDENAMNPQTWDGTKADIGTVEKTDGNTYMVKTPAEFAAVLALAADGSKANGSIQISLPDGAVFNMNENAWDSIHVDGYDGTTVVTIDGNGATISGLTSPLFEGGFAGNSGIVIKDLTIADSNITADYTTGLGAFVSTADSMTIITLENCKLLNSSVKGNSGARAGGLIGWVSGYANANDGPVRTQVSVRNCTVSDSTVESNGSVGAIIGHAGASDFTDVTIENCTVTGCKLNSTDDGGWRVGVAVGTANNGHVVINGITESANTVAQTGKEAPAHSNLYGRFVPAGTGTLVIDGVSIQG